MKMNKWKEWGTHLHLPHWSLLVLLSAVCAVLLVKIFVRGAEKEIWAIGVYALSFALLTMDLIKLSAFVKRTARKIKNIGWLQPYFQDKELRKTVSIVQGAVVSAGYALFKLVVGVMMHSAWQLAAGIYYAVLGAMRLMLLNTLRKEAEADETQRMKMEWKSYQSAGVLMFFLNAAMTGMAIQMIWQNQRNSYPGYVIYVSALHAFYALIHAVLQMIRFRKSKWPVFTASNALNFAGALMSIFILQTGLLDMFADSGFGVMLANSATGTCVLASVFAMAVMMVVQSIKELKKEIE